MRIALGTTSNGKKAFLEEALMKKYRTFEVITVDVGSGVSSQPLSQDETITGATNRAKRSFELVTNSDISFGLEGGMHNINSHYYYFAVVALHDGNNTYLGLSDSLPLPKSVSDLVKEGGYVGYTIRDYIKKFPDETSFQEFIKPIIDRNLFFQTAIANVLSVYENKIHF